MTVFQGRLNTIAHSFFCWSDAPDSVKKSSVETFRKISEIKPGTVEWENNFALFFYAATELLTGSETTSEFFDKINKANMSVRIFMTQHIASHITTHEFREINRIIATEEMTSTFQTIQSMIQNSVPKNHGKEPFEVDCRKDTPKAGLSFDETARAVSNGSVFEQPEPPIGQNYGIVENHEGSNSADSKENVPVHSKETPLPKPFGIGGMLAFFAFLLVSQPLFLSASIAGNNELFTVLNYFPNHIIRNIAVFYYLESARVVLVVLFSYITGLIISKGSKNGRSMANILLFAVVFSSLIPLVSAQLLPYQLQNTVRETCVRMAFGIFFWCAIWGLYLNLSKRCNNTYNTELSILPLRSCLWTGYKSFLGIILIAALLLTVGGVVEMRNATADNTVTAAMNTSRPHRSASHESANIRRQRAANIAVLPPIPELMP